MFDAKSLALEMVAKTEEGRPSCLVNVFVKTGKAVARDGGGGGG